MADVEILPSVQSTNRLNVTDRLAHFARLMPDSIAVACPHQRTSFSHPTQRGSSSELYDTITFDALNTDVTRIANGLATWGVPKGTRLALLVRPGIEFVSLVFGLLRAGMVIVLVDPGLGRRNLIRCLTEAEPEGFVAIGAAQAARTVLSHKFQRARWNVTVGRRWFWGGKTLDELRAMNEQPVGWALPTNRESGPRMVGTAHPTLAGDPAAIIFTSGSTGPPKGVLYTQQMFDTQVAEIQAAYHIEPGGIDLACFPLFALFNAAMGVTTVLPQMDFSRPASANSEKLLTAAKDWRVTQAFASPAVWRVLSKHCAQTGKSIKSLRQVFSCGAPVPADVMRDTLACVAGGAKMHTPYGATECLPVSTIEAAEVIGETAAKTDDGAGVCVGRKFDSIEWRVIRIFDGPIESIEDVAEMPTGEIGELIVRGPQVSAQYVTRTAANAESKIADVDGLWHRVGDVGYFDTQGRFWYCGRKSQRVETGHVTLFTECVEAIFNKHQAVNRCALVGVGERNNQTPIVIVEAGPDWKSADLSELRKMARDHKQSALIDRFLVVHWQLPVDVRHNAKINREQLAGWASTQINDAKSPQNVAALRSHAERGN